ncbi:molybdate metabolism regulator [Brachyspira pulli]|uniref:molybdate metabolism regulator n=1 Tax=Brachyspira pulli TaxID=310721 RepID=UPI0030043669
MKNSIGNEEKIRNKFEEMFSRENNKDAFLDYFYGRSNSCPTLSRNYIYYAEEIFKFYFDENTSKEDKEVLFRYAKVIIKDIYKGKPNPNYIIITTYIIVRLCAGEDLEKVLIESYNIDIEERDIHDKKYSKSQLKNNKGYGYIKIQNKNFNNFLKLENYIGKEFNQYLEKVKNDSKVLLEKEPHLLLTILVYIINRYDDKKLIKQLLNYIDLLKINDEETISLLFTIVDKDEEVYKRLMNILNKDNNIIYFIVNLDSVMISNIELCKRFFKKYSEDPTYHYFEAKEVADEYLEICSFPKEYIFLNKIYCGGNTNCTSSLTVELKKLYDEDKTTFYKLYEIIEKSKLECLYLDYAVLSSIMLAVNDNKYNIDTNSILSKLKEISVELLTKRETIKSFDDIISKRIKYIKEKPNGSCSRYLSAIMLFDEINEEASKITDTLLKYYVIYIKIYIYIQKIFYNKNILEIKEKLVNEKEVQLKNIYLFIKSEDDIITLIKNNLEETKNIIKEESFINSITENTKCTISFINAIFSDELRSLIDNKFDFVFKVLDTEKDQRIKNHCILIIKNYGISIRSEVEKLAVEGKKSSIKIYQEIIKYWDLQKIDADFKFKSIDEIEEYVNKQYNKEHESLIKDIDKNILSNILLKDKKTASPLKIVKYVFMEYAALKEPSILKDCNKIAEFFDIDSFRNALDDIYSNWLKNKSNTEIKNIFIQYNNLIEDKLLQLPYDTNNISYTTYDVKLKNILIPYCIFQTEDKLLQLKTQIEDWASNDMNDSEELAAYAVYAMALNGSSFALSLINKIYLQVKNNKVKKAAKNVLKKAGKVLDIL